MQGSSDLHVSEVRSLDGTPSNMHEGTRHGLHHKSRGGPTEFSLWRKPRDFILIGFCEEAPILMETVAHGAVGAQGADPAQTPKDEKMSVPTVEAACETSLCSFLTEGIYFFVICSIIHLNPFHTQDTVLRQFLRRNLQ